MAEPIFEHSEQWLDQLTLTIRDITSNAQLADIKAHVESCPDCQRMMADSVTLEKLIHALPAPDFPEGLPPRLLELWQEEDRSGNKMQAIPSNIAQDRPGWRIRMSPSLDFPCGSKKPREILEGQDTSESKTIDKSTRDSSR